MNAWSRLIALCTATTMPVKSFIQHDEWILEEKYDGDRVVLSVVHGQLEAFGRRNQLEVPRLLRNQEWNELEVVLDGEMLGDRYMAFDILGLKNLLCTDVPLRKRKEILNTLAPYFPAVVQVVPFAKTERAKLALLREAVESHKEGVVAKAYDSTYEAGRGKAWQKLKFYKTLEAVIMSIGDADGSRPEAARIGLMFATMHGPDELREVSGIKIPMKYQLRDKVQVGDVVEVRYLGVSNDWRLIQPVYLRKRLDKVQLDCYARQMYHESTSLPYYMTGEPLE